MNSEAGGLTVVLVGVLLVRLVLSDVYPRYVQPGLGPWLVVAGLTLILLGGAAIAAVWRAPVAAAGAGTVDAHGPDAHRPDAHGHHERAGWLLLLPVLAVLLAPPPALGSYGVERGVTVTATGRTFAALPVSETPQVMTLAEFDQRAADAAGASFAGRAVELTGFVAGVDPDGYRLARFQISCCAADAVAAVVKVRVPTGPALSHDTWMTVVGTFRGSPPDGLPELDAAAVHEIEPPVDPYE